MNVIGTGSIEADNCRMPNRGTLWLLRKDRRGEMFLLQEESRLLSDSGTFAIGSADRDGCRAIWTGLQHRILSDNIWHFSPGSHSLPPPFRNLLVCLIS